MNKLHLFFGPSKRRPAAVFLIAALGFGGCASTGPEAMKASRIAYNTAIQETARNELLLNLVRLRYVDSPEFLEVAAISSQLTLDASASLGGAVGDDDGAESWLALPRVDVGFSSRPTITFSPQREREFTRRLLAPVDADTLQALVHYGWGLDRVLRLTVQEMNGLVNATTREDPPEDYRPALREFADVATALGDLHAQGAVAWTVEADPTPMSAALPADQVELSDLLQATRSGAQLRYDADGDSYRLMRPGRRHVLSLDPEVRPKREILSRLGLAAGESYEIQLGRPADSGDATAESLSLRTRSVLGIMAYLSQGVSVPDAHLADGVVAASALPGSPVTDLFRVQVAEKRPASAVLAVPYRDFWFYIPANDLEARRTLGLLDYLLRLNVTAGGASGAPVLTLPVGR